MRRATPTHDETTTQVNGMQEPAGASPPKNRENKERKTPTYLFALDAPVFSPTVNIPFYLSLHSLSSYVFSASESPCHRQ